MGHSTTQAATSASRALRLLSHPDMRHQPATPAQPRRATPTTPGTPLNLGLVDHLTHTVDEVADHMRRIDPEAGPVPDDLGQLYPWYIEGTQDAEAEDQAFRDTVIERQRLEHAVQLGETNEVCKHPCPGCGRWGMEWDYRGSRAVCLHKECRTPDGMSRTWTLSRLAAQKVQGTEIWRRNAT